MRFLQMPQACLLAAACLLGMAADSRSAEPVDRRAWAKTIAPFIDAQTAAVAHVDLRRVGIDPLFDQLESLLGQEPGSVSARQQLGAVSNALQAIHADDMFVLLTASPLMTATVFGVIPLPQAADADAVRAALKPLGKPATRQVGGELVVAADGEALAHITSLKPDPRPELADVFAAAGDSPFQVAIVPPKHFAKVLRETLPQLPAEIGGGPVSLVTDGFRWGALAIEPPPHASLRLVIQSADAAAAGRLAERINEVLRDGSALLTASGALPGVGQLVAQLAPRAVADQVQITIDPEHTAKLMELLKGPLVVGRTIARQNQSSSNLKRISLAMLTYYDVNRSFPPPAKCDAQGRPLLSWRVLVLPYLDQFELYKQFHLDEPWDSPHNKTLVERMPEVYRSPFTGKWKTEPRTNYELPLQPGGFEGGATLEYKRVADGTSKTIMVLEVDDDAAAIWSQPQDLSIDLEHPLKHLGGLRAGPFSVGMMDGSVRTLPGSISLEMLRALLTPAGGEVVDLSKLQ